MKAHRLVFDGLFDSTFEQILEVIDQYLTELVKMIPEVTLDVVIEEKDTKKLWRGNLLETKEWGKEDIVYGHIEVLPVYENSVRPMKVNLYCNHPDYLTYWSGLKKTLRKRLPLSDGSPDPIIQPWLLVENIGDDRTIVEMMHQKKPITEIARRIGVEPKTIYNRLSILRGEYPPEIVPYKKKRRKTKKSGYSGN